MIHENLVRAFVIIMLVTAFVCFVVSELSRNYSQVDKLWSIMPIIYSIVAYTAYPSPRLLIMCCLVIIWGIRLSFNFYRKGGYNIIPWRGEEDYRWQVMRKNPILSGRLRFGLFNLLFISFYQHFLILLFCTPLLIVAKFQSAGLNSIDILALAFMLIFIILESIADNQLFRFQTLKKQNDITKNIFTKSLRQGFLSEGLWRLVRHPNYISEQLIWIGFYLFGVAASGKIFSPTIAGPVLLILLFQGSTMLTEKLSGEKYPEYSSYKKETPKFFPRLFRSKK